ncbi:hypothetical protein WICPIJ_004243 [Wickerhamomyces pijperi]|uniref:Uncharacterized protein n=1 Tax=Wickerhamomyces pijperi TaxID=599730 RepID=A0A9P8Q8G5_WICPI|nr:hypothetical protein WICPIJ_004243 [Wickerhamomyces pijperi]
MTYLQETSTLHPSDTIDLLINELESSIKVNPQNVCTKGLRSQSRDVTILTGFSFSQFSKLLMLFKLLDSPTNQLDVIVLLSNVMLMNTPISTFSTELSERIRDAIPSLFDLLDTISERKIISEQEYSDFLPIFRFYFLLLNYSRESYDFLQELRPSIKKILGKLLNFIVMSSLKSKNLNLIIIEILKILYSFIHLSMTLQPQVAAEDEEDLVDSDFLSGIDSSFVLSCNKFNLLYRKIISPHSPSSSQKSSISSPRTSIPSRSSSTSSTHSSISNPSIVTSVARSDSFSDELQFNSYDDILFHFGNVMLAIPTSISKNYMLNKVKFTENIIYYLNKYFLLFNMNKDSMNEDDMISKATSNLLTVDVLLNIDEDNEIKSVIQENLNFSNFSSLSFQKSPKYDNLKFVISELSKKSQQNNPSTHEFLQDTLQKISELPSMDNNKNSQAQESSDSSAATVSAGTDQTTHNQPTEDEIDELNDLFEKIEKNGIFKISMK